MNGSTGNARLVMSYLTLRKTVGSIGSCLPLVLAIGLLLLSGDGLQDSLSAYYHTVMRDVFVGAMCAIGVFLLSYRGYDRRDDLAANLACAFAVGTALFPTTPEIEPTRADQFVGAVHLVFAALFFVTLAYFSICLFTKTDPSRPPTPRKVLRNRVYRTAGYAMLVAIALIGVYKVIPPEGRPLEALQPVFWLESVAIVAFGISWLTKGEALLSDEA